MDKYYIVIEHINGQIDDVYVIYGKQFAEYLLYSGFIIFEVDMKTLFVEELERKYDKK